WVAKKIHICYAVVITSVRLTCDRLFFFFQAEDGIRDRNVTGVQTCAFRSRELRVRARRRSPEAHLVPRGGGLHDSPGRLLRGGQEHTSELQSRFDLVCRLLLEKKKKTYPKTLINTRKMLATELIVTIIGTLSHITMNLHYIA